MAVQFQVKMTRTSCEQLEQIKRVLIATAAVKLWWLGSILHHEIYALHSELEICLQHSRPRTMSNKE